MKIYVDILIPFNFYIFNLLKMKGVNKKLDVGESEDQ